MRQSRVAGSFSSNPASTPRSFAASVTVRAIGPAVSWSAVMGTMPWRLTRPSVGLMPTSMFALEGLRIDPEVSVPTPTVARLAPTAIPGPELEPPGVTAGRPSSAPWRVSSRVSYGL